MDALASRMAEAQQQLTAAQGESSKMPTAALAGLLLGPPPSSTNQSTTQQDSLVQFEHAIHVLDDAILGYQQLLSTMREDSELIKHLQSGRITNSQYDTKQKAFKINCEVLRSQNNVRIKRTNLVLQAFNQSSLSQNQQMNTTIRGKRSLLETLVLGTHPKAMQATQVSSTT